MFENLFSERGLSLDRLRALVAVDDAGGIAQAAPGDPVRQSQYSRQLGELAAFFGREIARRRGKLLELTEPGKRLADLARSQLRSLQDFRAECRAESIDYTIAAGDSVIHWLVIPRLGKLRAESPSIRVATLNLRTNDIVRQLGDGRLDFGIIRQNALVAGLKSAFLGPLTYCVVVPVELVGSAPKSSLRDVLTSFPLAAQTSDGQFTQRLHAIARDMKADLRPALACQSFPQILSAVRSGAFAAVVPQLALNDLPLRSFVEITAAPLRRLQRELVLAWNPRLLRVRPEAGQLAERLQKLLRITQERDQ